MPSLLSLIDQEIAAQLAFPIQKFGDTPTDANQLTPKKYVDGNTMNLSVGGSVLTGTITLQAGNNITITRVASILTIASTGIKLFGDNSDGAAIADTTSSIAGATLTSSVYSLTRDVFYSVLTFSNNSGINANGYQIFVNGVTTIATGSTIFNNGGNGSNGGSASSATPGGGGSVGGAAPGGTLSAGVPGSSGGSGGAGVANNGSQPGTQGGASFSVFSVNPSIGVNGSAGASVSGTFGMGGAGSPSGGGSAGPSVAGGIATLAKNPPDDLFHLYIHADLTSAYAQHGGSAGGGGGQGGGAGGSNSPQASGAGGGGGGSGAPGGIVALYSKTIVNNATGGITARGGNGGNAGNGGNGQGGGGQTGGGAGGCGGNGGEGGVIIYVTTSITGTGTITVPGGTGGAAGTAGSSGGGGGAGNPGVTGNSGAPGKIWSLVL